MVTKTQIECNCLRGETFQRELWFPLDSEPQDCHETRHGTAVGTPFPLFWISSLQWLFPQCLRTDDLGQIHCIQWRQQSKHKGNLPSSAPQSDRNAVAPFFPSPEYLELSLRLDREEGRKCVCRFLGYGVAVCCFCSACYCTDPQTCTHS